MDDHTPVYVGLPFFHLVCRPCKLCCAPAFLLLTVAASSRQESVYLKHAYVFNSLFQQWKTCLTTFPTAFISILWNSTWRTGRTLIWPYTGLDRASMQNTSESSRGVRCRRSTAAWYRLFFRWVSFFFFFLSLHFNQSTADLMLIHTSVNIFNRGACQVVAQDFRRVWNYELQTACLT